MHVVAIQLGGPLRDDEWIRSRADAVGVSFYELRARLRVLDGWPGVLATFAGADAADAEATGLARDGIPAWVLRGEPDRPRALVRSFSISAGFVSVDADRGIQVEIPIHDVRMLVVGTRLGLRREHGLSRTVVSPVARSSLWITPNLGAAAPAVEVRSTRESFIELHAAGRPVLCFEAGSLQYRSMPGTVEPTRAANFKRVVQQLRGACPRAYVDERLAGRMGQVRMLGPTLPPETHLDLALAMVAGPPVGASPYR